LKWIGSKPMVIVEVPLLCTLFLELVRVCAIIGAVAQHTTWAIQSFT